MSALLKKAASVPLPFSLEVFLKFLLINLNIPDKFETTLFLELVLLNTKIFFRESMSNAKTK